MLPHHHTTTPPPQVQTLCDVVIPTQLPFHRKCGAVCCSVLQLQCVAVATQLNSESVVQCVAVATQLNSESVVQCVAVATQLNSTQLPFVKHIPPFMETELFNPLIATEQGKERIPLSWTLPSCIQIQVYILQRWILESRDRYGGYD